MQMLPILTLMITTVSHLFKPVSMLLSTASRHFSIISRLYNTAIMLLSSATAWFTALYWRLMLDVSLQSILSLLSKGLASAGALMLAFGAVKLGIAIPNHNGPDIANALLFIVGGAIVVGASALVNQVPSI